MLIGGRDLPYGFRLVASISVCARTYLLMTILKQFHWIFQYRKCLANCVVCNLRSLYVRVIRKIHKYCSLTGNWQYFYFCYLSAYGEYIISVCRFKGSGENSAEIRCRDFFVMEFRCRDLTFLESQRRLVLRQNAVGFFKVSYCQNSDIREEM